MFFAVDPPEVGATSVPVATLVTSVLAIDMAADLAPLAMALPGSDVGSAVPSLGTMWESWLSEMAGAARLHSGRLTSTEIAYAGSDRDVRALLSAGHGNAPGTGPS